MDVKELKDKIKSIDKEKARSFFERHKHLVVGGVAGLLVFFALISYVLFASSSKENYSLLFTNLTPSAVEEVVKELSKEGISFKVSSDGKSVYVPKEFVYSTRILLASKGLPTEGKVDFGLFKEPKFGMSKYQMKILYQQAVANEIARSIESLAPVKSAKVIISFPEETAFLSDEEPRASAVLELYPGESLTKEQVKGIINLLVKSVRNLKPENVSVIDQFGNDLSEEILNASASDEVEKKFKIKKKLEREIETKILTLLAKAYGASRVSVKANVDLDFTQEEVEEHFYDPDKSAVVSEKREKEVSVSSPPIGGIPGTTSNLPPPVGRDFEVIGELNGKGGKVERKKSIVNYNTGEVRRKRILNSPVIKRLTVSVLVSGKYVLKGDRLVYLPVTEEELQEIERAVKTAVGYNPKRGDVVTVATLPFESVAEKAEEVTTRGKSIVVPVKTLSQKLGVPQWVILVALVGLLLILVVLTALLLLRKKKEEREIATKTIEELLVSEAEKGAPKPTEEGVETLLEKVDLEKAPLTLYELAKLVPGLKVEELKYEPESVKVDRALQAVLKHIEAKIKEDPKKAAEIIRRWLNS